MTRQLTVKLKFEVEEEGGVTTALLRVPLREPLIGEGETTAQAVASLCFNIIDCNEEVLLVGAVLNAAQEACLAALWTP